MSRSNNEQEHKEERNIKMGKIHICLKTQKQLVIKFLKNFKLNISFKTENNVGKILTKKKRINPRKI